MAVPVAPGTYALILEGGRFADTDSILVQVDSLNDVRVLRFVYSAGKRFEPTVADYEKSLGRANISSDRDSTDSVVTRAQWTNLHTHFEVRRASVGSQRERITSLLQDGPAKPQ
jgi:hypothetical protein